MPSTISTISELLSLSGSQYRVYDIGRKVSKLSKDQFTKIELNQLPYPFPLQGHAQLAVSFWQKSSAQPYLWFIKLPLDERGLLNQGARNHFLAIIIEALGTDMSIAPTENQEERLKENPYHFTPSQYKLAFINSLLNLELKQPPSQYHHAVLTYLTNIDNGHWQELGVQGIVDFSLRLKENNNKQLLLDNFDKLPQEVLFPLCSALENTPLDVTLIEYIVSIIDTSDEQLKNQLLRALSSSLSHPFVKQLFIKELNKEKLPEETLVIIAGRCWQILEQPTLMMKYLELLVNEQDPLLFSAIFKDIVAIPSLRTHVFSCIRSENRSQALAQAIGNVFKAVR